MAKKNKIKFGEWQKCPICEGAGQVVAYGHTSSVYQQCDVCNGNKIIQRPIINIEDLINNHNMKFIEGMEKHLFGITPNI